MDSLNVSHQSSLNFDTLAAVIPWITLRKDLLSFLTTCSGLYNSGILTLLGHPSNITNANLRQFHAFLTSRASISFAALRDVKFCLSVKDTVPPPFDQDGMRILTNILSRARNLRYLQVDGDILHKYPSICETLALLPSLVSLTVPTHPEDTGRALLTSLQSSLTKLVYNGASGEVLDLQTSLAKSQHTLKEFILSDALIHHSGSAGGAVFSRLVRLELNGVTSLLLSVLIPAFPNLESLELLYCHGETADEDEENRGRNIQFQKNHPSLAWHLSSLTGDATSLYSLSLKSKVPEVKVTTFLSEVEKVRLGVLLPPLRPQQLILDDEAELTDEDEFFDTLSLIAISQPYLSAIHLTLYGGPELSEMGYSYDTDSDESEDHDDLQRDIMLATRAIQAIPSLKVIVFTIVSSNVWTSEWVCKTEGEMSVVEDEEYGTFLRAYKDWETLLREILT
ncbi:hypothetical protein EIP86_008161 [Pleurotus ostreatoroseus]|nr:hypothetical protein EIP86_008161 [Pleurotus ostreatoroseus]